MGITRLRLGQNFILEVKPLLCKWKRASKQLPNSAIMHRIHEYQGSQLSRRPGDMQYRRRAGGLKSAG